MVYAFTTLIIIIAAIIGLVLISIGNVVSFGVGLVIFFGGNYYAAIEGQQLQTDLYAKFEKASSKFKELLGRAGASAAA